MRNGLSLLKNKKTERRREYQVDKSILKQHMGHWGRGDRGRGIWRFLNGREKPKKTECKIRVEKRARSGGGSRGGEKVWFHEK